jgi:hypothetical protein
MDDMATNHDHTEDEMNSTTLRGRPNDITREEWEARMERRWERERTRGNHARDDGTYVETYMQVARITSRADFGPVGDGEPGSATCPHCGAWGRYVYGFTTVDGEHHGAMAGCVEVWPGGKAAVAAFKKVQKRLDQITDNAKSHGLALAECYDSEARALDGYQGLLGQMLDKAARYDISPKQAALIAKLLDERAQGVVRQAERKREQDERKANAKPVPTGDGIIIEGVMVKRYWQDNDFGGALRMIVEGDDGWRVWGTLPASLMSSEQYDADGNRTGYTLGADEGDRVRFTANITASDDDPSFGFCKRPRKASIISTTDTDN